MQTRRILFRDGAPMKASKWKGRMCRCIPPCRAKSAPKSLFQWTVRTVPSTLIGIALLGLLWIAVPVNAQGENGRPLNPDAITLAEGYKIEPRIANLSVPTTAIFDGNDLL